MRAVKRYDMPAAVDNDFFQRLSETLLVPVQNSNADDPSLSRCAGAVCIGVAITLCVYGYQFGQSNHTLYLLNALHRSDPSILANDWFTTQTFQYHAAFSWLTRGLMRIAMLRPGFLA